MAPPPAGTVFWVTLGVLAAGFVALAVLGLWQTGRVPATGSGRLPDELLRFVQDRSRILQAVDENVCSRAHAHLAGRVGPQVEAAFAPVYGRIPALADWHYSVIGEYVELGQAAAGGLAAAWEERLFRRAGPGHVLEAAVRALDAELVRALRSGEASLHAALAQRPDAAPEALEPVMAHVLGPLHEAVAERTELQAAKAAVLGGGLAGRKLLVALAGKTLAAAGTKLALKTGSKWAAGASAGAGAAALCSVVPGLGTVACGVGGALAAWLAFDAVAVNVDERLHRESFEAELRALVDEARAETEAALGRLYRERIDVLCARMEQRIRALDEERLMRWLNRPVHEQLRGTTP